MRNPLILMPSSVAQVATENRVAAHDLYVSPIWSALRKYRGLIPWQNVFVLSPKYGFISAQTLIHPYTETMTARKAAWYQMNDLRAPNTHYGQEMVAPGPSAFTELMQLDPATFEKTTFTRVLNAGPAKHGYMAAFAAMIEQGKRAGLIGQSAQTITLAGLRTGDQMREIGVFAREGSRRVAGSASSQDRGEAGAAQ